MDLTSLAVAGMSLVGTLAGTFGGILVSKPWHKYKKRPDRPVGEEERNV